MTRLFRGKGPVYRLDRRAKARMIEAVLTEHLGGPPSGRRLLDVGCGNGDIAAHFARANAVTGVDVADRRRPENRGFEFHLVDSEALPLPDDGFDVVLSNHVIEHVDDQQLHLAEVRRVLAPGGVVYMATPNRTSPIMPGHVGNDRVLAYREMGPLFERAGFEVHEYSIPVLRQPARFESDVRGFGAGRLPRWLLRRLRPLFPSHVFVLSRRGA